MKLSLFADNVILIWQKQQIELLELSKAVRCKISLRISREFLNTSKNRLEHIIKKRIIFMEATKTMKYLRINKK